MPKTVVKLKAIFTDDKGGTTFPGDVIRVDDDLAKKMIRTGGAVAVANVGKPYPGDYPAHLAATKPVVDTQGMKGIAKVNHLRKLIRERGEVPRGGVDAMTHQLRVIG